MILITTSDYFPQIGGLTSFTENIINVLKKMEIPFELFHWKNYGEIENYSEKNFSKYELIINIHPMFCWLKKSGHEKMINFIHGSEILMTSPNPIKKIVKHILRKSYFKNLEKAKYNFFISNFTKCKIESLGFNVDYSRDVVFHNCIDVSKSIEKKYSPSRDLKLICIARNVPHKNIRGAINIAELLAMKTGRKTILTLSPEINLKSKLVEIKNLKDYSDEVRSDAYRNADFNLLMSEDHSHLGFFEGFGLTTMEAAVYGTPSIVSSNGGLPEAIHHGFNGIVLKEISESNLELIMPYLEEDQYIKMSSNSMAHVKNNHDLFLYRKLFQKIMERNR